MTYNVFSGTLNPTHFTSLAPAHPGGPGKKGCKTVVVWCGVVSFLLTCEMHLCGWCLLSGCDGGGDGMWRCSVEARDSLSEVVTQWCSDGG